MAMPAHPASSLEQGIWFKLICGASFHHLPSIRNLALIYTLAGADCIDLAADPAIVAAAQAGIRVAQELDPECGMPWLMSSFNDGEDPHFRKAVVQSSCPEDCQQPCLQVCPPFAIIPVVGATVTVQSELCYGCGRCEPVCPYNRIQTLGYQVPLETVLPGLLSAGIQAVEIHTHIGRLTEFRHLWQRLRYWVPQLQVLSISLGDGDGLEDYLWSVLEILDPFPQRLIWQTDGRPMSGDLGVGATRATLHLATKVLAMELPGYVQMAGGTNQITVTKARQSGIPMAGVAYGSYARQLVSSAAELSPLEDHSDLLFAAVAQARELVTQVKSPVLDSRPSFRRL